VIDPVLVRKAVRDAGFDIEAGHDGTWARFGLSGEATGLWVRVRPDPGAGPIFELALSRAVPVPGDPSAPDLPPGAHAGSSVASWAAFHEALQTCYRELRARPGLDAPVETTEAEALVRRRRGQEWFRTEVLRLWQGRCALTGLGVEALLRASHARPWAVASDAERLDPYNGLLLAAHLDAAFDRGLLSVTDDGAVVWAATVTLEDRRILGVEGPLRVRGTLDPRHLPYLAHHRAEVFLGSLTFPGDAS
jgi:hypothetical protein